MRLRARVCGRPHEHLRPSGMPSRARIHRRSSREDRLWRPLEKHELGRAYRERFHTDEGSSGQRSCLKMRMQAVRLAYPGLVAHEDAHGLRASGMGECVGLLVRGRARGECAGTEVPLAGGKGIGVAEQPPERGVMGYAGLHGPILPCADVSRNLAAFKRKPNTAARWPNIAQTPTLAQKISKKFLHGPRAAVYILSRAKAQLTSRSGGIGRRASLRC